MFFHGSNDLVVRTTKIRDQWCTCRSKSRQPKDVLINFFAILYSNLLLVWILYQTLKDIGVRTSWLSDDYDDDDDHVVISGWGDLGRLKDLLM